MLEPASPSIALKPAFRYYSVDTLLGVSLFAPVNKSLWAMITAYFDESGTHGSSKVFVVAGLVAPAKKWLDLDRAWTNVLESEGIPEFHMVDCAHGVKLFKGWEKKRREKIVERLVNICKRHVCWRVWTAVLMDDYRRTIKGDESEELVYGFCASACIDRLTLFAIGKGDDCSVKCDFERGGKGSGRLFSAFDDQLDLMHSRIDELAVSRRRHPAIQAADLHAYEIHKYFTEQVNRTGRPPRKSFLALLSVPEAHQGGHILNKDDLVEAYRAFKADTAPKLIVFPLDRDHLPRLR